MSEEERAIEGGWNPAARERRGVPRPLGRGLRMSGPAAASRLREARGRQA